MEQWKAIELARRYVLLERGERALEALKHASPESAETWLWRANALHLVARYDEAIEAARRGLAIDAESPYLHHALARAELALSHFGDAEAAILDSLRLDPEDPDALALHALILIATGRRAAGRTVASQAVALAPEARGARLAEAWAVLGSRAENGDDLTRELLRAEPEGAEEHWLRAIAHVRLARFGEAARHYERAAALKPDNEHFVRAAHIARHWAFWPLRMTAPYSLWIVWTLLVILAALGFLGMPVWTSVGYCVAFLLYAVVAMMWMIAQPFGRR